MRKLYLRASHWPRSEHPITRVLMVLWNRQVLLSDWLCVRIREARAGLPWEASRVTASLPKMRAGCLWVGWGLPKSHGKRRRQQLPSGLPWPWGFPCSWGGVGVQELRGGARSGDSSVRVWSPSRTEKGPGSAPEQLPPLHHRWQRGAGEGELRATDLASHDVSSEWFRYCNPLLNGAMFHAFHSDFLVKSVLQESTPSHSLQPQSLQAGHGSGQPLWERCCLLWVAVRRTEPSAPSCLSSFSPDGWALALVQEQPELNEPLFNILSHLNWVIWQC